METASKNIMVSKSYNWFDYKSVKGKMILFSMTLCIIILSLASISIYMNQTTRTELSFVANQRVEASLASLALKGAVYQTVAHLRGFIITRNTELIEKRNKVYEDELIPNLNLLNKLKHQFTNPDNVIRVDSITESIGLIKEYQKKVESLVLEDIEIQKNLDASSNDSTLINKSKSIKAEIKTFLVNKLNPELQKINVSINLLSNSQKELLIKALNNSIDNSKTQQTINIFVIIISISIAIYLSLIILRSILNPLSQLKNQLFEMATGQLPADMKVDPNEIGEMAAACNTLVDGLKTTTEFAKEIGLGHFDTAITPEKNELGTALYLMRDNLKSASIEDQKRSWATEGMAKFGDILRGNQDEHYFDRIISELVKYIHANQGGLFISEDEGKGKYLNLSACYAYDRKKIINKRVELGEGLVGQCFLEAQTILITEVPQDYLNITSGLGKANPKCILIVPLKVNAEISGVLEFASFKVFEAFEIDFIEKIAESIASTIVSVKTNERTKELLMVSQQQTEEMRAQEEEMRQNMEEMQSTQEEMERKDNEMQIFKAEVEAELAELRQLKKNNFNS